MLVAPSSWLKAPASLASQGYAQWPKFNWHVLKILWGETKPAWYLGWVKLSVLKASILEIPLAILTLSCMLSLAVLCIQSFYMALCAEMLWEMLCGQLWANVALETMKRLWKATKMGVIWTVERKQQMTTHLCSHPQQKCVQTGAESCLWWQWVTLC